MEIRLQDNHETLATPKRGCFENNTHLSRTNSTSLQLALLPYFML